VNVGTTGGPLQEASDVPEGWAVASLAALGVSHHSGVWGQPPRAGSHPIPVIRNGDIDKEGRVSDDLPLRVLTSREADKAIVQPGDILATSSGDIGKVALWNRSEVVAASNFLRILRCSEAIEPAFLNYYLRTSKVQDLLHEMSRGITLKNLPSMIWDELCVPLAPLPEQRRIVAKVEAVLTVVNAARDRLSKVPTLLRRFRESVLAEACSGRLTAQWRATHGEIETAETTLGRSPPVAVPKRRARRTAGLAVTEPPDDLPETWTVRRVRDLAQLGVILDFQDGNHGSLYPRTTDFGLSGVRFITAKQVFDDVVRYGEAPLLSNDKASRLRIGFTKPGDVLLTHNATVGRVGILPNAAGDCILGTSVTYYRLRPDILAPRYCMYFMQSRFWQDQLRLVMEQTTRNQVSVKKQAEFWIALPPPDEQQEIIRLGGLLMSLAASIDNRVAAARSGADRMQHAILSQAFEGELVTTEAELARREGRAYEPAATLIERVSAEKASSPKRASVGTTRGRRARRTA